MTQIYKVFENFSFFSFRYIYVLCIILASCCHGSDKYQRLYSCKNLWDDITNLKNILQHIKNSNARTCTDESKKDTNYCKGCYNV